MLELVFALLAAAELTASARQARDPNAGTVTNAAFEWVEARVGEVPDRAGLRGNAFIEAHGWHYGLVLASPSGKCLWLDGAYHPIFDDFVPAQVFDAGLEFIHQFSPDGKHLAYAVRQKGKMHMVLDGQSGPAEETVDRPVFSPDGRHLAYVVKRNGRSYLLLDGVPGPACDHVGGPIHFSPNGQRIAYTAQHGNEYCMVVDQEERHGWPGTGISEFSPDGKHIAYISKPGFAVLDGLKGPELPAITWWGPVFSADSRHFAYTTGLRTTGNARHRQAFVDGHPLPLPNNGTSVWNVVFSPDLKRWACLVEREHEKQVFVDGHYGPAFRSAWGLTFDVDGSRFVYRAEVETNWWMVVDSKLEAEIDLSAGNPCFSPDGKRLAYIAGRGPMWWMMLDGKAGPKFRGRRGHRGWEEVELPALTSPQFSPDSSHLAYAALEGGQWGVFLDHQPVAGKYDSIVHGGPSFHEDGTLEFLGIRSNVLYRTSGKPRAQNKRRSQGGPSR